MGGQGSSPSLSAWLDASLAALRLPAAQQRMGSQIFSGLLTPSTNPMAAQGLLPSLAASYLTYGGQTGNRKIERPTAQYLGGQKILFGVFILLYFS